ncbi:hypothetical protein TRVA0_019S02300 [Trichomonascus vanleenenianus]|uniref:histidine phosphatase family protein n=1 Tax=Trichomonascus vanleenenianus TaxID=2268995 RepID=UPI003EC9696F
MGRSQLTDLNAPRFENKTSDGLISIVSLALHIYEGGPSLSVIIVGNLKMIEKLIVVRHATRLDSVDKAWAATSATPYDTPLVDGVGTDQAYSIGSSLGQYILPGTSVYIHTSPFLRCVQTATYMASALVSHHHLSREPPVLRMDASFGEWQTQDYYADYSPPPPDNHLSLALSSRAWLNGHGIRVDDQWPLTRLGPSGEYDESWAHMRDRFAHAAHELISYYDNCENESAVVVIVTHGAGCNALLGTLENKPLLSRIGLASFAVLERTVAPNGEATVGNEIAMEHGGEAHWRITFNSNAHGNEANHPLSGNSAFGTLGMPALSSSTSTSSSSVSELVNPAHGHSNSSHPPVGSPPMFFTSLQPPATHQPSASAQSPTSLSGSLPLNQFTSSISSTLPFNQYASSVSSKDSKSSDDTVHRPFMLAFGH